jgi:hypothetical protein
MRSGHNIIYISTSPKTDPAGEGTKKFWELLDQQHTTTSQNTTVRRNTALDGTMLEASTHEPELVIWQSIKGVWWVVGRYKSLH